MLNDYEQNATWYLYVSNTNYGTTKRHCKRNYYSYKESALRVDFQQPFPLPLRVQLVLLFKPVNVLIILLGNSQRAPSLLLLRAVVVKRRTWIAGEAKEGDARADLERDKHGVEA